MSKKIITVALTGGGAATKENNPHIPETVEEVVESAYLCYKAGAAIAHIHARDKEGKVTADPEVFRAINTGIRGRCDIIVQNSTGVGRGFTAEERLKVVEAGPEMASLNMGTLVRRVGSGEESVFLNSPDQIESYVKTMGKLGIKPEMEAFNLSMLRTVKDLIDKKLVSPPYVVNLVLGMRHQGGLDATPKNLFTLFDNLPHPESSLVNVSAIGWEQHRLTTMGMIMGGNIRVGLEDNLFYSKGVYATNEMLVERAVRLVNELQYEVATPAEARSILGIPQIN